MVVWLSKTAAYRLTSDKQLILCIVFCIIAVLRCSVKLPDHKYETSKRWKPAHPGFHLLLIRFSFCIGSHAFPPGIMGLILIDCLTLFSGSGSHFLFFFP